MEVENPGFGALLMDSKSAQWPIEEEMPANAPTARKPRKFSELKTLGREGAVIARNPSNARPIIKSRICLGANPLSVSHRIQRYNPTKRRADKIE